MSNGNPFYVQPAMVDVTPVMQGLTATLQRGKQRKRGEQAQAAIMQAVESGDARQIAEVVTEYPEFQDAAKTAFGFTNQASEQAARDTYRRVLADPENASQHLDVGIRAVSEAGGRPEMMARDFEMMQQNPQAALKAIQTGYASIDPEGYKSLFGTPTDSLRKAELGIKLQALDLRKEEAEARRDEQRLKREDNALKREELQLKVTQRREKINNAKKDLQASAKAQIRQQGSLSSAIDSFLGNKTYVDAVTGYRGRVPAVTTTGIEAEAFFDQIRNNLTLENLDKMSGVLSETDIKILSNAASALVPGMGKKALRDEMTKIQNVLSTKSQDVQERLLGTDEGAEETIITPEGVQQTQAVEGPEGAAVRQTTLTDMDQQALQWAQANPNDPRAVQIMQRLGVQ